MPDITGTLTLVTAAPQLGQPCQFAVTTEGLQGNRFPRVHVEAKQNDVVVYGEIRELDAPFGEKHPDHGPCTFTLGGGSSDWLENIPPAVSAEPSDCTARLFYADPHGEQIDLATVAFVAAGA